MASRDSLDMMFIASWSDYTEGHEIEPTVENGDRELRTTLHYAAQFKEMPEDASGIALPARLFDLRKRSEYLASARRKTAAADALLDQAAAAIAGGSYSEAAERLSAAETAVETLEKTLKNSTLDIPESELRFSSDAVHGVRYASPELKVYLPETAVRSLIAARTHTGYLEFEYFDDAPTGDFVFLYSRTERQPKDIFATVAKFKTDGTGTWKRVRVELAPENVLYATTPGFTLMFKGKLKLRDVSFHYTLSR